jgi:FG-GAP-like repeat/FG-GAP repeat
MRTGMIGLVLMLSASALPAQSLPEIHQAVVQGFGLFANIVGTAPVGDVTGDGVPDYAVAAVSTTPASIDTIWQLNSGADGQFVRTLPVGAAPLLNFGVTGVGDLNGDGHAELVLGWQGSVLPGGQDVAMIELEDGATGATLWFAAVSTDPSFLENGLRIVRLGDLDGDGVGDLVCLVRGGFFTPNRVRWLSGASGALLHEIIDGDRIVFEIASAGDTNGDGFDDLLLAAPTSSFAAPSAGGASLISGADFSYLRFWNGSAAGDEFGTSALGAGDVNQDGFDDVMITARAGDYLRIYSGIDNSVLATHPLGLQGAYRAGVFRSDPFDWNGDGTEDHLFFTQGGPTLYQVRSGIDFSLLAETNDRVFADINGDLIPDSLRLTIGPSVSHPSGPPPSVKVIAHQGAEPYGIGSSAMTLTWEPSSLPSQGNFTLSGGSPGAPVVVAGSTQAISGTIFGTSFPLLIDPSPASLFLQVNTFLDAFGELRAPVSLRQPALAGTVLYYQWAELSPNPGTSNGLQLLFDA